MTLGFSNEMSYNFDVFLLILFTFYSFLSLLLLFYYIPFSTKPQDMFILNKNRFFSLATNLVSPPNKKSKIEQFKAHYSQTHLLLTLKKMQLWAEQIDTKVYETIDGEILSRFLLESERLAHLLLLQETKVTLNNPLVELFLEQHSVVNIEEVLASYASTSSQLYARESQKELYHKSQDLLDTFFSTLHYDEYTLAELVSFYESIKLRKSIWTTLFRCEESMKQIDFDGLKASSF
jgi:hypothetical protein